MSGRRAGIWPELLAVLVAALVLWRLESTREERERAAWNRGYYGVDRATALEMARRGIGLSADELLGLVNLENKKGTEK